MSQIWWANPDLINFWIRCSEFSPFPGLWFVEHFLRISKQTTDRVAIKFGGPDPLGSPSAWLTFDHAPLNSLRFLASVFFEQFPGNCRQTIDQIELKLGGSARYGSLPAWLTFGHAPLNSRCLLASDWLSSLRACAHKPLIRFSSSLVGQLIMGLFRPDQLLVSLHRAVVVSWPSSFHTFTDKQLISMGSNSMGQLIMGLVNFWWRSTEFPPFCGLWLVEQFPRICRQTVDWIGLKFGGPLYHGLPPVWLTFGHAPLNPNSAYLPLWLHLQLGTCIDWWLVSDSTASFIRNKRCHWLKCLRQRYII